MQSLGGNGYINGQCLLLQAVLRTHRLNACSLSHCSLDYPMGRIVRDSRLYTVGAGSQEIRRMLIGREFNAEFKAT